MSYRSQNLALAALATAVGAAIAISSPASAQQSADKERCYGISMAGKNDCASTGNNSCAGTAKMDFDKGAWKYVAKGTCTSMQVKLKDGSSRMGALMPIKG
ncbi:DUF2282 domain-containing protein [Ferrovibrio sp.]|uniref:BufA1 family periplasmic bufferin-type metallophore n=1 Tax=Ferrovibrio sp. TaxID=1917215 RepID=UPI0025B83CBD|nr:DUF2282 domain-containing protein [Ferrovibrio sp.]MBX3453715.1 DUF2282 domain-containing protein [Ferrovibrio sp.]